MPANWAAAEEPDTPGVFAPWDEQVPWPAPHERQRPEGAVDVLVHRACEEYRFLHDNAVMWHGDTLFAAWYNCPRREMQEASAIRGRRSRDRGRTWSGVEMIADDRAGKGILYVPVAFLSHGGTLYAYVTNMVGADLVVNCEVFALDEAADRWESRGSIADMFLPNGTPVRMDDGNFIMVGRVADRPRTKPEWPAVAISDGENVTEPWTVVRLMDDRLLRFPETTVWVDGANITAISRSRPNGCASPGRVFTSSDFGRTWRGPMCHNLPELTTSKLYVIYTSQKNHSAMTIIPVESLTVERPTE